MVKDSSLLRRNIRLAGPDDYVLQMLVRWNGFFALGLADDTHASVMDGLARAADEVVPLEQLFALGDDAVGASTRDPCELAYIFWA